MTDKMRETVIRELEGSAGVLKMTAQGLAEAIVAAAGLIADTCRQGKKVLLAGNGGSAADAQHIAAELVGRYAKERKALAAIALTTDTSILTALANDYGYDHIFSRQLEALAEKGDTLIAMTTSGASTNILQAINTARSKGVRVIAMTGQNGGKLKGMADVLLAVPSAETPHIQEAHIAIGHVICHLVEREMFG